MTVQNFSEFLPAMTEDDGCPYCGGPAVNVAFEYITCGAAWDAKCFGHQIRTPTSPDMTKDNK